MPLRRLALIASVTLSINLACGINLPAYSSSTVSVDQIFPPQDILDNGYDVDITSITDNTTAGWENFEFTLTGNLTNPTVTILAPTSGATLEEGEYELHYTITAPTNYTFTGANFSGNPNIGTVTFNTTFSSFGSNEVDALTSITVGTGGATFNAGQGLTNSYQAVPWETDVLPLAVATALFAGAVWWKQKRGQKTVISDQLSGNSEES